MKNIKRKLALVLSAVFALSLLAGCGPKDGKDGDQNISEPEESSFSVTLHYNEAQGTVSLSEPDPDGKYERGSEVTITVKPADDYAVTSLKVNGVSHAFVVNQYSFKITQNTTVEVGFMNMSAVPNVEGLGEYGFKTLFRGSWIATTGDTIQIVKSDTENKLLFNDAAVTSVVPQGDADNEQVYRFTADGHNYMLSWADTVLSVGYVLSLLDMNTETRTYFVLGGEEALGGGEIAESYRGDWRTEGVPSQATKLTITSDSILYDGKTPQYIVDGDYRDTLDDTFKTPIYNNVYFFIIDNQFYKLVWYNSSGPTAEDNFTCPVVNQDYYVPDVDVPYTFPEAFRGTWNSADAKVVITETTLTINGEEIPVEGDYEIVRGYNPNYFLLVWKDVDYIAEFMQSGTTGEYVLQFEHSSYNDEGFLASISYVYFVNENAPGAALDASLDGTWKYAGEADIVIDVANKTITWGADEGIIIAPGEERTDGYAYYVLFGNQMCTISYLDLWAGYDVGDPIDRNGDGVINEDEYKKAGETMWVLEVDVGGKPPMYFQKSPAA